MVIDGGSCAEYPGGIVPLGEVAMIQSMAYADVLYAAEQLDADALAELVAVLSRHLAKRELVASVGPRRGLADVVREIAAEQRSRGFHGRSAADLRAEDDMRLAEDAERDQELDATRRKTSAGGA
jgi:hypothetical protein